MREEIRSAKRIPSVPAILFIVILWVFFASHNIRDEDEAGARIVELWLFH